MRDDIHLIRGSTRKDAVGLGKNLSQASFTFFQSFSCIFISIYHKDKLFIIKNEVSEKRHMCK